MNQRALLLAAVVVLSPCAIARSGPSFDCGMAQSPVELAICGDDALAEADQRLAESYHAALKRSAAVRQDQRTWLKRRNADCGADVQCLRRAIEQRIVDLSSDREPLAAGVASHAVGPDRDASVHSDSGASGLEAELVGVSSPSFDCEDARWTTAVAICSNPELAKLDGQMGVLLRHARARFPDIDFDTTQRMFREDRNARCRAEISCIESETFQRVQALRSIIASEPAALAAEQRTVGEARAEQNRAETQARKQAATTACIANKHDEAVIAWQEIVAGTHSRCQGLAGHNVCEALVLACGVKSRGDMDEDADCLLKQAPSLFGC